jgi:molybdenum cofactor sulfurtransferase
MYLRDNHNSVLGIRQLAAQQGAACTAAVELAAAPADPAASGSSASFSTSNEAWRLAPCGEGTPSALEAAAAVAAAAAGGGSEAQHLFAFPLESNFSGVRYDPGLVTAVQSGCARLQLHAPSTSSSDSSGSESSSSGGGGSIGAQPLPAGRWRVLLDCAKACGTCPPDLLACPADFAVLSFYKIFGYPTGGLGCRMASLLVLLLAERVPNPHANPFRHRPCFILPWSSISHHCCPTCLSPAGLGALLVRKDALPCLRRPYFGGGTVAVSLADEPFHRCLLVHSHCCLLSA